MRTFLRWVACGFSTHRRNLLVASMIPKWVTAREKGLLRKAEGKRYGWILTWHASWAVYRGITATAFLLILAVFFTSLFILRPPVGLLTDVVLNLIFYSLLLLWIFAALFGAEYMAIRINRQEWPYYLRYAEYVKAGFTPEQLKQLRVLDHADDLDAEPTQNARFSYRNALLAAALVIVLLLWRVFGNILGTEASWLLLAAAGALGLLALKPIFSQKSYRYFGGWMRSYKGVRSARIYKQLGEDNPLVQAVRQMRDRYPNKLLNDGDAASG